MVLQDVRLTLQKIEKLLCSRGASRAGARGDMAAALSIGGGTLENLLRDRVKSVNADLAARIKAYWPKIIAGEIARLEHELDLARKINLGVSPSDLNEAETRIAEARELLRGKGGAR